MPLNSTILKKIKKGVSGAKRNEALPSFRDRDCITLAIVETFHFVKQEQMFRLLYKDISKCGKRLRALKHKGLIKSKCIAGENVWFIDSWSQKYNHWLQLAEWFIRLCEQKPSWEEYEFYTEFAIGNKIADGFLITHNKTTNKKTTTIVEIDLTPTNKFKKVKEWNEVFAADFWIDYWWANLNKDDKAYFPKIIVVTTRPEHVLTKVEQENINGLKWEVIQI